MRTPIEWQDMYADKLGYVSSMSRNDIRSVQKDAYFSAMNDAKNLCKEHKSMGMFKILQKARDTKLFP